MISKKICLVGDFGVGKTSLIRRFVDRQFSDQYLSTVGVKISRKVVESLNVQLLIWDLEGHTKFKAIAPTYLQGSGGAVIVADVTRPETIDQLSERVNLFSSVNPKGSIMIALNKIDLIEEEKLKKLLQQFQLEDWKQALGIYPTSAKTGSSVDEMFERLAAKMIEPVGM
ncbi:MULTISPECIES: Rab family GTPase [unclassified Coleofasciculus]|uniref:Rab family GTPase n=1 Tax=unclassified Coleofasciculus TaxID=2692782 RepID=UPI00187EA53C|nr:MULTISPECIES: Rab family GTPase [unclassified Coleofasciculus]MBE9129542.1 GTP-binding protein [Coleofasciculus sp. LEGE 07081]MBE9151666.1 GTP-binding protein [Coleofasciculus sp. LEGE 07092]